jgi:hypothetical protein
LASTRSSRLRNGAPKRFAEQTGGSWHGVLPVPGVSCGMHCRHPHLIAAEDSHIGVSAQTRPDRNFDLAILGFHQIVKRTGFKAQKQPPERRIRGEGGLDVQEREVAGTKIGIVRDQPDLEGLSECGDLDYGRGPQILMTRGGVMSCAPASKACRKSCGPAAFAPSAMGVPPSRRTRAKPS